MTDVQTRADADNPAEPAGTTSTRRVVLLSAGALGAGAVLTACGTDNGGPGSNPNGTDFDSNPVPAGSTGAQADSAGGNAGTVLVAASEVAVGGGVIKGDYVITQPEKGSFKAFSKVCTHQGCDVTEINDGSILCRCHNSAFSIKDGQPTAGPATQPLPETKVSLDGDNVVAA
ncbi:Rieske (2Fe-2S) protein [Actinoplanes sp. NPDC024001]|uniref:Rieske (2Fe-2S) protein n=1 Tax=Actinoplanes sp. NPDC024001 TaxID=3154598 RepID=UPI0033D3D4A0